eukprot:1385879-Amorphochlora_amoeboformis.AAC.1
MSSNLTLALEAAAREGAAAVLMPPLPIGYRAVDRRDPHTGSNGLDSESPESNSTHSAKFLSSGGAGKYLIFSHEHANGGFLGLDANGRGEI